VSACTQTSTVDDDGRWAFELVVNGTTHFVEMPGLPQVPPDTSDRPARITP